MRKILPLCIFGLMGLGLLAVLAYPQLDLIVSGWFYTEGEGFLLAQNPVSLFLQEFAIKGAWSLGTVLVLTLPFFYFSNRTIGIFSSKSIAFVLLALLLGPVLITNLGFKDHWGRARPREVTEFGGASPFSPALAPQPVATRNGSFVSGDASFGFYLPCFAYLLPLGSQRKKSRSVFWCGMAAGGVIAFSRIGMGAHFLSDNLFAALLMLTSAAALHAWMYGRKTTRAYWREWLGYS